MRETIYYYVWLIVYLGTALFAHHHDPTDYAIQVFLLMGAGANLHAATHCEFGAKR